MPCHPSILVSFARAATRACGVAVPLALFLATSTARAQVRISQVYTQGGVSPSSSNPFDFDDAPFHADFVELYNAGASAVNISGYSIQFQGPTSTAAWTQFNLTGAAPIQPNSYFLIRMTDPLSAGGPYPFDLNRTGTASPLISTGGKVALVSDQVLMPSGACPSGGSVVDFVGISGTSTANCSETSPIAMPPNNTPRFSVFRKCGGTIDTDNNAADFEVRLVNPRWSGSPPYPGIDVTVNLSAASVGPCYPTSPTSFFSVVRGTSNLLITVSRSACSGPPSTGGTVTADLSQLGGSASQMFFDDGTNGDVTPGDNVYSYRLNPVPANAPMGVSQTITATVTDAQARTQTGVARVLVENAAPANDPCANATLITSTPFTDTPINNRLATDDTAQPLCGATMRYGVWYRYVPSQNGVAVISETGPQSAIIAVYTGSTCGSLALAPGGCYGASSTNNRPVPMTAGTTYWIAIGPSSTTCPTSNMTFTFDYALPPPNDTCATATPITSTPYAETVNNIAATDDSAACAPGGNARLGVWYRYLPTQGGVITMTETGGQNAMHAVWSADPDCGNLIPEFCSTTDTNQATGVAAGTTYYILLASDATTTPTTVVPFVYSFDFAAIPPPPNDDICDAGVPDVSAGGTFTTDNRNAQPDAYDFCLTFPVTTMKLGVWHKFTAAADGVLRIVENSTQDIAITVLNGPTCTSTNFVTCTTQDSLILPVTNGETYWILVGHPVQNPPFPTQDLSVTFTFRSNADIATNSNYTCATATPLTPGTTYMIDNSFSLPGQDVGCNNASATNTWHPVWFSYTPPSDCAIVLNETSTQNAVIAVFSGFDCNTLTEIFCTDTDTNEHFELYAATQYWIMVGINSSSRPAVPSVNLGFNTNCTAPAAGDACTSAFIVPSLPYVDTVNNASFTNNAPGAMCDSTTTSTTRNDVWYRYTATGDCTGVVSVDPPSSYDVIAQVWQGPNCQNLTIVRCSNANASSDAVDYLSFPMQSGQTYWVQYGRAGTTSGGGSTTLAWNCVPPPPNDRPCDATVISGGFPFFDSVDISGATHDVWMDDPIPNNPPVNLCGTPTPSATFYGIWYTYTATSNCTMIIEDTGPVDVNLGAFIGACDGLTQIDCTGASTFEIMTVGLTSGTTYWFLIGHYGLTTQPNPSPGPIQLTFDCRPAPPNDLPCGAVDLNMTGTPYSESVDVAAATHDVRMGVGAACVASGATHSSNGVWYKIMPASDCTLTVNETSTQNASIGVFTGLDCTGLNELLCTSSESLSTGLTAGNTYWILVSLGTANPGMSSQTFMEVTIDCGSPPPNDQPCNATVIASTPYSATQSITLATDDVDIGCNNTGGTQLTQKGVWWRYVPTSDCLAVINETSSLDVAIALFQDFGGCTNIGEIGCASTDHFGYPLTAGTTYYLLIGLQATTPTVPTAALSMTFDCVPNTPPPNDLCTGATVINSLPFNDTPFIPTATHDPDVVCNQAGATSVDHGVWYRYTAAANCTLLLGEATINNVVWGIYSGADCNSLVEVNCTTTEAGASHPLTAGTTYWILVGLDWNSNGTPPTNPGIPLSITIDCAAPPTNDTCPTAQTIASLPFSLNYEPFFANSGQPIGSCNVGSAPNSDHDVWFTWTATANCDVTVNLQSTSAAFAYGPICTVYDGPDCNSLFEVACGYAAGSVNQFPFVFSAAAGHTYWFQNARRYLSNSSGNSGPTFFSLSAACACACPGDMQVTSALDGEDIPRFVECVIDAAGGAPTPGCECADLVGPAGIVDQADVGEFVDRLLNSPTCP